MGQTSSLCQNLPRSAKLRPEAQTLKEAAEMTTTKRSNFCAALRTTDPDGDARRPSGRHRRPRRRPEGAAGFLVIALVINLVTYWFSDKIALAASGAKPVSEEQAPGLYAMVRELTTRAEPADAAPLRHPHGAAERVRHGPQPQALGGGGHGRHHQAALRGRAPRRDLPRARPRPQPRHPHPVRRRGVRRARSPTSRTC